MSLLWDGLSRGSLAPERPQFGDGKRTVAIRVRPQQPVGNEGGKLVARNLAIAIAVDAAGLCSEVGELRGLEVSLRLHLLDGSAHFARVEQTIVVGIHPVEHPRPRGLDF